MEILKNLELWQRIAAFPLDDPNSAHPFSKKLMTEQRWSENDTLRVIAEYKKFIYLAIVEPNGASPSKDVDDVWHLHITYTEGYAQFCQATAGRFLHHHPSKGGETEHLRHKTWATDTLQNYYKHFGYAPPKDVWDVPLDFSFENEKPIKIDSPMVYQPSIAVLIGSGFILGLFCLLVNPHILGSDFLISYILAAVVGLTVATAFESKKDIESIENDFPTDLNHLQVATFLYGASHAAKILLVDLMDNQVLKEPTPLSVKHLELHRLSAKDEKESLYQNPLYTTLACVEKTTLDPAFLKDITQPILNALEKQLAPLNRRVTMISYLEWAIWILGYMGAIRLVQGFVSGKPIGFLVLTLILIGLFSRLAKSTVLDDFRNRVYEQVRLKYRPILSQVTVAERFAFEGSASLDIAFIPMLLFWDSATTSSVQSKNGDSGDYSSGDGCGGSSGDGGGCGGGCGGCGGCGG